MTALQDKTPEELNVICAELCGWTKEQIEASRTVRILRTEYRKLPKRESFSGWAIADKIEKAEGSANYRGDIPAYATSYDAIMPCVKALTDKQTFAFIEHLRVIRNIQATGDFAFTWLMMTSSEADLTRAMILTLTT